MSEGALEKISDMLRGLGPTDSLVAEARKHLRRRALTQVRYAKKLVELEQPSGSVFRAAAHVDVYIDTNVFLNVLRKEPHYLPGSQQLLQMTSRHELDGITSDFTVAEIVTILRNRYYADVVLKLFKECGVTLVRFDRFVARAIPVIEDEVSDRYDLIHAGTAFAMHVAVLVTRNKKDFVQLEQKGRFSVWDPERTVKEFKKKPA